MNNDKLELQYIKGIGPKRAEAFASVGIFTDVELAGYFPRDYISRDAAGSIKQLIANLLKIEAFEANDAIPDLLPYQEYSIVAKVIRKEERSLRNNRKMLELVLSDGSGSQAHIIFWQKAQYFAKAYNEGDLLAVSGKPEIDSFGKLSFVHPEIEKIDEDEEISFTSGKILPKYKIPLEFTKVGITSRLLRQVMLRILDIVIPKIHESLPREILEKRNFPPIAEMLYALHFPSDIDVLNRSKKRMKFEEIFLFELYIELRRMDYRITEKGFVFATKSQSARELLNSLPFDLTAAQKRVIWELSGDMSSGKAMNRLLQGDVGSGKTIVALLIALMTRDNGFQTVFMAPTEILAQQHYNTISKYLEGTKAKVGLLVGGQKVKMRRELFEEIASGEIDIIVGTHALFESKVEYKNLGYVIIDEQHRFGVSQRYELLQAAKRSLPEGYSPHTLVMSATPIPRTLSMTVYGDLDVSVINGMPKNRKPITTKVVFESHLEDAYNFIRAEVKKGRQAYIVYPLVEKSEKLEAKSAVEHHEMLSSAIFSDLKVGLLHGQMFWYEKEEAMQKFLDKEFDILVATTVVEVGIDVPNASVMLIENAERFGLSQLHQLRGRVGRGAEQSYCFLATKDSFKFQMKRDQGAVDRAAGVIRLKTMESTTDGFKIADADLELRGPGDMLGERQSGLPEFRFVNLASDGDIITEAKAEARELLESDPRLAKEENATLKRRLIKKYVASKNYFEIA